MIDKSCTLDCLQAQSGKSGNKLPRRDLQSGSFTFMTSGNEKMFQNGPKWYISIPFPFAAGMKRIQLLVQSRSYG